MYYLPLQKNISMTVEQIIKEKTSEALKSLYGQNVDINAVQIQDTRKEFDGDFTIVVFPFLRISKKNPEQTANEIGNFLKENSPEISDFNVIKGFLNISVSNTYWVNFLNSTFGNSDFGYIETSDDSEKVMIEFSSPNTNKPLHLGHIRNILLGDSIARILKANGKNVIKVNLVNDRGIHICKSMLAWQLWGNNITPEKAGKKGDKLVGDFYVLFDVEYKKEIKALVESGIDEDEAKKKAPVLLKAQEMLRKWEAGEKDVLKTWEMMNSWVYSGFDETYEKMGIDFDKIYYESNTYKLGKKIVIDALAKGQLIKKDDDSVWADLTDEGLDEKILLRSDGTSVYMTQDIGTAHQRFEEFDIDKHIYVVGNEQNYHFQVLKIVLKRLGFSWADAIYHLSYGMVELPSGKMKSREGTVVDADDLINEMLTTAREISKEQGRLEDFSAGEVEKILHTIALGALKYFILKVDPKKNMTFVPEESIDFNGNTGPFIQYTFARIKSVLNKSKSKGIEIPVKLNSNVIIGGKEHQLLKLLYTFPGLVKDAGTNLSPAQIANYVYDLAREYNQFYHDFPILKEENKDKQDLRLLLSVFTANTIKTAMKLLGVNVPPRM